jgi:hypothetical protein
VRLSIATLIALLLIGPKGEQKIPVMNETNDLEIFTPRFQMDLKFMLLGWNLCTRQV